LLLGIYLRAGLLVSEIFIQKKNDDFHMKVLFPVLHDYAESRDILKIEGVLASANFA
jgi:hypothetical protein